MILYNVLLPVRTADERPPFWDHRRHSLLIWIFGRDHEHAGDRALRVAACLPYDLARNEIMVVESANLHYDDDAELDEKSRIHDEIARRVGLSIAVCMPPPAADHPSSPGVKIIQLPTISSDRR